MRSCAARCASRRIWKSGSRKPRWRAHFASRFPARAWIAAFVSADGELCAWDNSPRSSRSREWLRTSVETLLKSAPDALGRRIIARDQSRSLRRLALGGLSMCQDPRHHSSPAICSIHSRANSSSMLPRPAAKRRYLAELMKNTGAFTVDLYESRVARLRENLSRLGITNTQTFVHDCNAGRPRWSPRASTASSSMPPCSNTASSAARDVRCG